MYVLNGEAKISGIDDRSVATYVNSKGKFRAEYALGGVAKENASSFESITDGKRTLIIQGYVSPSELSTGQITWGVSQFGNAGCSARLTIEKQ